MSRVYHNFDLVIAAHGDAYEIRVTASPAGEATGAFEPPFSSLELENFRLRSGRGHTGVRRGDSASTDAARTVGGRLFAAAFGGAVGERLRASLEAVRATGACLRVRVAGPPELAALPWEYLYSPDADRFMSVCSETPVVRYLPGQEAVPPPPITAPLKVLAVMASPVDYPGIDAEREWASLSQAVEQVAHGGLIQFERLEEASLTALQRRLRKSQYHIVHFVGHGAYDARNQEGALVMEDADRKGYPVGAERLGVLLHDHPTLRLAVLNTCESGRMAPDNAYGGAAQALVRARIPYVIGMQFEVSNDAATTFAEEFYRALVDGCAVEVALTEARKAIFAAGSGIEWGTPVLYTVSADTQLLAIDPSIAPGIPAPSISRMPPAPSMPQMPPMPSISSIPSIPSIPSMSRMPMPGTIDIGGVLVVDPPEAAQAWIPSAVTRPPVVTAPPQAVTVRGSAVVRRGMFGALLLLACIFAVNLVETAYEARLSSTVTDRGLEFASALHWLEGGYTFENHDLTNAVSVYGFSIAYFFVFPVLVLATGLALARNQDPRAFRTYTFALAIDYALSLPFFLAFPVPERWAYPDASATLLSDMWDSRLIEAFRPISALDNCFPSFHTSMTVVLVLCCFVYRVGFRMTTVPLGAMVLLSTYSLGVHWVGDVVAGAALGVIGVAVACRLVERRTVSRA